MTRELNDPASWWFFAAIHGEYVNPATAWYPSPPAYPAWGFVSGEPAVPTSPLPSQLTQDKFWNQCQHGTWYFLPWHRGYLFALEAQLRVDIVSLGGPESWALPYWNYFGGVQGAQAAMPPAFSEKTLPDGTPNALYVTMRFGPDDNGTIYIPTPDWVAHHPDTPKHQYSDVTDICLQEDLYTGSNAATPLPGFGGPDTGFSHPGDTPHGNLESNPHDLVHVYVGGNVSSPDYGVMADPGTAALDPIFYLHHCNIDRMWAGWNDAGNVNPDNPEWLSGPAQQFVMPMPGSEPWVYTPEEVQSISSLNYVYQEATVPQKAAGNPLVKRLQTLNAFSVTDGLAQVHNIMPQPRAAELLGANFGPLEISKAGSASVDVTLHPVVQKSMLKSLQFASVNALPDQLYLKLENVRGTQDATVLRVYVDLPPQADQDTRRSQFVGSVGLFGLRRASVKDGAHVGAGLTFILDISRFVDTLFIENRLSAETIRVNVETASGAAQPSPIEVGRVSIYRQPI
ncbi:tyrosinase family protein [Janthinobacterium aquaticum]|nr:tyrosinase family protein [Janthinobacterium sp. FT58W]